MIVETFIRKAAIDPIKDPFGKTMRYSDEFLISCTLLRMKSHKAFDFLKRNLMLPLPDPNAIRRRLSSTECKFGLNELALEHMFEALKDVEEWERWGCLMWDEMAITKDLRFDATTLKWKGIADLGGETTIMVPNSLADHVLVFVFRPFLGGWIQPFAWYGTTGGAKADVLVQLITKAIACLFQHGAIVSACVSDGYSTNKSAMKELGITGEEGSKTFITHPMDDNLQVYFLVDVPHLIKCTRNHMLNHKQVQVSILLQRYLNESAVCS